MIDEFKPKERKVIPNWRYFENTLALGELDYYKTIEKQKIQLYPIDDYISTWLDKSSLYTAGDLISSAISNSQLKNPHVLDAAKYILKKADKQNYAIINSANFILENNGQFKQEIERLDNDALLKLENVQDVAQRIHELRLRLHAYPFNSFIYVDIARAYISIGQKRKAENMIKTALYLAPNNRFVTRSACRLYVHLEEFDKAYDVLRHNSSTKHDPWLMSAEITIKMLMGRMSNYIKEGKRIVESRSFTPYSITELSSTLATIEMYNGTRKKSRDLFNISLIAPNDNSLAQAQFAAAKSIPIFVDESKYALKCDYEVKTFNALQSGDFKLAMSNIVDWICDMPFSHKPILLGSNIASTYLQDYNLSAKILEVGKKADIRNPIILNNLSYSYARLDDIFHAEEIMSVLQKIDTSDLSDSMKVCIPATQGIIAFRKKDFETGRKKYEEAINLAEKNKEKDPITYSKAWINYMREELIATGNNKDMIDRKLASLPDLQNPGLQNLIAEIRTIMNEKRQ